jgi:putative hydrolase of HD superfamily
VVDRIRLAGLLKIYPRSGWFVVGIQQPERVADHVFRVMVIADILAEKEGYDRGEEVIRAMLHDLPEAVTGDHHYLAKKHIRISESRLWEFLGLEDPGGSPVLSDADQLELLATAVEYGSIGVKGLNTWIEYAERKLQLDTSKEIAQELKEIVLGEWYVELLGKIKGAREAEREVEPTAAAKRA